MMPDVTRSSPPPPLTGSRLPPILRGWPAERWPGHRAVRAGRRTMSLSRGNSAIHVCPLRLVPATVAASGARHLISVINQQMLPPTPPGIVAEAHLRLAMNDIAQPLAGLVHPTAEHVGAILEFSRRWDRNGPLVVHCLAGISRSTAAAYIALCDHNPGVGEDTIARQLRAASLTATPNSLMIAIADRLLGRHGRMIAAIGALGPGLPAQEAMPFQLSAEY